MAAGGATVHAVELMAKTVGGRLGVSRGPVREADGRVVAFLNVCHETTGRVMTERRLRHLPVVKDLVPDLTVPYAQLASVEPWMQTQSPPPPDRDCGQIPHRTFPGKTRFSIEGLDMLVPVLDEIIGAGEFRLSQDELNTINEKLSSDTDVAVSAG